MELDLVKTLDDIKGKRNKNKIKQKTKENRNKTKDNKKKNEGRI